VNLIGSLASGSEDLPITQTQFETLNITW
jgi:hypothetical protein